MILLDKVKKISVDNNNYHIIGNIYYLKIFCVICVDVFSSFQMRKKKQNKRFL